MRLGEFLPLPTIMRFDKNEEITGEVVMKFIKQHQEELPRYKTLGDMYKGNADIFKLAEKDPHKPDIRLSTGMPRFIVDTFTGYFNGIPVKKTHIEEEIAEKIEVFEAKNNIEDEEHELAKLSCIYGRAYELIYQNEKAETKVTYISPENCFVVYDDTVEQERLFAVVYQMKLDGSISGTLYQAGLQRTFTQATGNELSFDEELVTPFDKLNVHEFYLNEERMGLFEPAKTMIDNYNKALSEKANDVDYFSDSYMKILGLPLEEEGVKNIRENRLITASGDNAEKAVVEFLDKPDSDQATEHLLDRLERLIFQMTMVANLSDENFGQSSGTALAYKLQAMSNLALSFQRKFEGALRERYELVFNNETKFTESERDEWENMEFTFTRNQPKNVKEEIEAAIEYSTIGSLQTALSMVSKVPDVRTELRLIEEERNERIENDDLGFGGVTDETIEQER